MTVTISAAWLAAFAAWSVVLYLFGYRRGFARARAIMQPALDAANRLASRVIDGAQS